ncbi:probable linoleate 9S-lipoxygenase 5 [Andrographis paniculata]|uniref:probable linoleate 9S-lipoxygenase 5 n=1 Tax=Andrographis paniculata TaxID=175694 RepID=UPI0021E8F37E|nr:probable linoleate 9S-lipoxygenase 5 [Andrographis paniculata]
MFNRILQALTCRNRRKKDENRRPETRQRSKQQQIKGTVVLVKKNVLDFNDFSASVLDTLHEFVGRKVSLQLISSVRTTADSGNKLKGKVGKTTHLENWITTLPSLTPSDSAFTVNFDWDEEEDGVPGAFIIKNFHHAEFYLKTLTLDNVPGHGRVHFMCNSWVYPANKYKTDRIFFTNQAYLPSETPAALLPYREEELMALRGDGTGELQEWDRVYDYAYYNDLGDPDKGEDYARPVLGGSSEYPYPRRGRTGRPPTKTDPTTESRIPLLLGLNIHVPRDERYGHLKMSDFLGDGIKSIVQFLVPEIKDVCDRTCNEFDSFEDVYGLYEGGIKLPDTPLLRNLFENIPFELVKEVLRRDGDEGLFKFPMPRVIQEDKSAWRTDEEFAREMLAGVNPVVISRLKEFPPRSKLDPKAYGNQMSTITIDHLGKQLDGLTVDEAVSANRLFILDHHDTTMPYLRRINTTTPSKVYASRTILFLQNDWRLKVLAIELSLPHPNGDQHGAVSKVYTPADDDVEGSVWQLAKAYVAVNDSGRHQLISHWLNTHAAMEPFVIATNRQLSALHPIHKLLQPHFRDTMNINAFGRQVVINAGGILETTVFPVKYSMEMSSAFYKDWIFPDQALPADLLKRGMAVEDASSPYGLRLLIEDYPYAVDGLKVWSAIKEWVDGYCKFYYASDEAVQGDTELQSWWKELRNEGHGDKWDEPWWPAMRTRDELVSSCTIIIWTASALHAALNFGQYPYGGYMPNRPTMSRRLMPEPGSQEYEELRDDPERVVLRTITAKMPTLMGIALIELLSRHSSDEVYLGQRDTPEWTRDEKVLEAFGKFGKRLEEIEKEIVEMNGDGRLKNRMGSVEIPYTLLYRSSGPGLTGKGIPNSVSI